VGALPRWVGHCPPLATSPDPEDRWRWLADSRFTGNCRGRCWSPTEFLLSHTTRANLGVKAVSALVFEMNRVASDPERLAGGYCLAHTTWSHNASGAENSA
jgi:hypothetical protein